MAYELGIDRSELIQACLYASVAHAVSTLKHPFFDYEQSWEDYNYSTQNTAGGYGTVSFRDGIVVGAFRNENQRLSFQPAESYLGEADPRFQELAREEAFEYLLFNVQGETRPVVTAAFWGEDQLFSQVSLEDFKADSDNIVDFVFLNEEEQREYWDEQCEPTPAEHDLVESLFRAKLAEPTLKLELSDFPGFSVASYGEEGVAACQAALAQIPHLQF